MVLTRCLGLAVVCCLGLLLVLRIETVGRERVRLEILHQQAEVDYAEVQQLRANWQDARQHQHAAEVDAEAAIRQATRQTALNGACQATLYQVVERGRAW